jgi:glyoxylase-like metal-dependent hydrolase (beta-lactamase superfamily II)
MDNVHRLGDGMVNFYLVEDDDGLVLVDSGLPGHYAMLLDRLAGIGRTVGEIRAVLLTHGHLDHLGLAERIRQESGAGVWVHPADRAALAKPLSAPKAERSLFGYAVRRPAAIGVPLHVARNGGFRTPSVAETRDIVPGAPLDVPGRPLAVAAPGHTPGSVMFSFAGRGLLFTGDALITHDGVTGGDGPRIPSRAFTADSAQALRSLDALAGLEATLLLPGHGEAYAGRPVFAAEQARRAGAR